MVITFSPMYTELTKLESMLADIAAEELIADYLYKHSAIRPSVYQELKQAYPLHRQITQELIKSILN